ncbi:unnamed protein product [Gadus morhua 'NCC']
MVVVVSLCFVVFSLAGALKVSIPKPEYEHARGDNITLPCNFLPKGKPPMVIIIWTVNLGGPSDPATMILTRYPTSTDVPPLYEGRASLALDIAKGKADLKLSSITLQDNKVFSCRVQIPGDDEGKLVDSVRLVVLVAPSKPVCALQGTAEYGQNVNLTCLSAEGSPTPVYSWEQRDVRNTPRLRDPRTTDRGGILSLYNISMDTSGYFICTSKNKIRSASCNITLKVLPPSMNLGSSAGIIGGVIAVLLVLALIILICCCCKKRKQREAEKYAMATPEEGAFADKEPVGNGKRRDSRDEEERSEYDRRVITDDRRVVDDDRRVVNDDRRVVNDDRRVDDDDRRSDYTARRSDYDDRRSDFDDRRSDYDDRRSEYSDRRDRYDDRDDRRRDDRRRDDYRNESDRYDEPYDDAEPARPKPPSVPNNKPPRDTY